MITSPDQEQCCVQEKRCKDTKAWTLEQNKQQLQQKQKVDKKIKGKFQWHSFIGFDASNTK